MSKFNYAKELLSVAKMIVAEMKLAAPDEKVNRWENAGPSKRSTDPKEYNKWVGKDSDDNIIAVRYQISEPNSELEEGGSSDDVKEDLLGKVRKQFPTLIVSESTEPWVVAAGEMPRDIVGEAYLGPLTKMLDTEKDEEKKFRIRKALEIAKDMSDNRTELGKHFNSIAKSRLLSYAGKVQGRGNIGQVSDVYSMVTEKIANAREGTLESLTKNITPEKFIKNPESVYNFFSTVFELKGQDVKRSTHTKKNNREVSEKELEGADGSMGMVTQQVQDPNYVPQGVSLNDEELAKTKKEIDDFIEDEYGDDAPRAKAYWEVFSGLVDQLNPDDKGVNNSADFTPAINKKLREIGWLGPDDKDLENSSTSDYMGKLRNKIRDMIKQSIDIDSRKNKSYRYRDRKMVRDKDTDNLVPAPREEGATEPEVAENEPEERVVKTSSDRKASLIRMAKVLKYFEACSVYEALSEVKSLIG